MTVSVDRWELSPRGQPNRRVPIHIFDEIELRVFRYLWEKVDLKLPPSPKCANVVAAKNIQEDVLEGAPFCFHRLIK